MGECVMRFRLGEFARLGPEPWIWVYADGRVERRAPPFGPLSGALQCFGQTSPDVLAQALAAAAHAFAAERPAFGDAHDPTRGLEVELRAPGGWQSYSFHWGRASRNDAYLAPVEGEVALEHFHRFVEALDRMAMQSTASRTAAKSPTASGAAPTMPTAARSVEEIARRLIASPPERLSALERVIGSLEFCAHPHDGIGSIHRPSFDAPEGARFSEWVSRVSVKYAFDMHHERPYALDDGRHERDPHLHEVTLHFAQPGGAKGLMMKVFAGLSGTEGGTLARVLNETAGPGVPIDESPLGAGVRHGAFVRFGDIHLRWYGVLPGWAHWKPSDPV